MSSISFPFCVLLLASLLSATSNPGNNGNFAGYNGGQGYPLYAGNGNPALNGNQQQFGVPGFGAPQNFPGQPGVPFYAAPNAYHYANVGHQATGNRQTNNFLYPPVPHYLQNAGLGQFMPQGQMNNLMAAPQPTPPTVTFQAEDIRPMYDVLNQLSGMLQILIQGSTQPQQPQTLELTQTQTQTETQAQTAEPKQPQAAEITQTETTPDIKREKIVISLVDDEEDEPMAIPMVIHGNDNEVPVAPYLPLGDEKLAGTPDMEREASLPDAFVPDADLEEILSPASPVVPSSLSDAPSSPDAPINGPVLSSSSQEEEHEPFVAFVMAMDVESETGKEKSRAIHSRRRPKGELKEKKQPKKPATKEKSRAKVSKKSASKKTKEQKELKEQKKRKREVGNQKEKKQPAKKVKASSPPAPKKTEKRLSSELKDLAYTYERRDVHLSALGRTRECKQKAVAKIHHFAVREAPTDDFPAEEIIDQETAMEEEVEEKEVEPKRPIPMMRPRGIPSDSSSSSSSSMSEEDSDVIEILPHAAHPAPAQEDHDSILAELNLFPSEESD